MKEKNVAILMSAVLLIFGSILTYYSLFSSDFNFYKSELKIDGNSITETLHFKPDKNYHTLFRTFQTSISTEKLINEDGIKINDVSCSVGEPYARIGWTCKYFGNEQRTGECMDYTENNEYGCSFGFNIGFYKGNEYKIVAEYELSAQSIFNVKGKNYIKFIAYSQNKHKYLKTGNNLVVAGEHVGAKRYYPKEYVIIYVPYHGSIEGKNVVKLNDFEFDNGNNYLFFFLISIVPPLLFFLIWYFFGREKSFMDVPESLSGYPKERKAWEVAAFFSPPFNKIDDKFFASIMLDFYHKKIIDIRIKDGFLSKKTLVKINKYDEMKLDEVEKEFLQVLEYISEKASDRYKEEGYINFSGAAKSFKLRRDIAKKFKKFNERIKKIGEKYVSTAGNVIAVILFIGLFFFYSIILNFSNTVFIIYILIVLGFVLIPRILNKTSFFTRHKADFYSEYQQWQAFKNYLEAAPTIKEGDYKAVKLWDKYMVYALALGISKKALKQLRDKGIINDKEYNASIGFVGFSHSFSTSTGTSSGGGFGGAGGGGVGGGGGGGR